ncbi:MAG TPA: hypothetical protein VMW49_05190 [Candidatus Dormibacteraeota bacterium]|nr:hypothetical protein [Candidatus Dormibacteraeota bacterium]
MQFVTGFGLGMLVAAQMGPPWRLRARSVRRRGLRVGLVDPADASWGWSAWPGS